MPDSLQPSAPLAISPDEADAIGFQAPPEENGDLGEQIKAGAVGAAAGAPFGTKLLEAAGVAPERQEQLKTDHPGWYRAGQIGTNVAELAAASAVAPEADIGLLGKMVSSGVKFGAQNVQNTFNERDMGDPEANSESLVNQFGLGALTGAVGEPLMAVGAKVASGAIAKASNAVAKLADAAPRVLGQITGTLRTDLASEATKEAVTEGVGKIAAKAASEGAGTLAPRFAVANEAAEDLGETLRGANDTIGDVIEKHYDTVRPAEVKAHLEPISLGESKPLAQQFVDTQIAPAMDSLRAQAADGILDAGMVKQAENFMARFAHGLEGAESTPELYTVGKDLSRELDDNVMRYEKTLGANVKEAKTLQAIEQAVRTPLRQFMTSPEVWGRAGAAAEMASNEAYSELKAASRALYSKMGYTDLTEAGRPTKVIKDSKVAAFAKAIAQGKIAGSEAQDLLDNYVAKAKAFLSVSTNAAKNGSQSIDHATLTDTLKNIVAKRNSAVAAQGLAWTPSGSGAISTIQGAALAHMIGGAVPGLAPAAVLAQQLWRNARNPAMAAEVMGYVKAAAQKQGAAIARHVGAFLSSEVPRQAIERTLSRGVLDGDRSFSAGAVGTKKNKSEFAQRRDEIQNLIANPTALDLQLKTNTQRLSDGDMPLHAQGMQASAQRRLQVLAQALPPKPPHAMLPQDAHEEPNPDQVAAFERVYATVKDPVGTLMGSLRTGTLTPDMITAAEQATPHTLSEIRQAMSDRLLKLPKTAVLSYDQRQQLSLLMGAPVSADQDPLQTAFQQTHYSAPPPPQPQAQKPRAKGLDKMSFSDDAAFGAQRLENARTA